MQVSLGHRGRFSGEIWSKEKSAASLIDGQTIIVTQLALLNQLFLFWQKGLYLPSSCPLSIINRSEGCRWGRETQYGDRSVGCISGASLTWFELVQIRIFFIFFYVSVRKQSFSFVNSEHHAVFLCKNRRMDVFFPPKCHHVSLVECN